MDKGTHYWLIALARLSWLWMMESWRHLQFAPPGILFFPKRNVRRFFTIAYFFQPQCLPKGTNWKHCMYNAYSIFDPVFSNSKLRQIFNLPFYCISSTQLSLFVCVTSSLPIKNEIFLFEIQKSFVTGNCSHIVFQNPAVLSFINYLLPSTWPSTFQCLRVLWRCGGALSVISRQADLDYLFFRLANPQSCL